MSGVRRPVTIAGVTLLSVVVAMLALAAYSGPAAAFEQWAHDGATGCSCHANGKPTDATCANCHTGFKSFPDQTCWSCHAPGSDTSPLSTPSSACLQQCHLWNQAQKSYNIPFQHSANPHIGATPDCLSCHQMSVSITDPGTSPHHSGQATGFTACSQCHPTYQQHAGKLTCATCHTTATAFHLYQADSPGFKNCGSCHSMRHAGKKVPVNKCATCHQGTGTGGATAAQHSSTITRNKICGACHKQKLHASAVSRQVRNCGRCHGGKYHARQRIPGKSTCKSCHTVALRHDDGYQCTLCHRRAIHNPRPSAVN